MKTNPDLDTHAYSLLNSEIQASQLLRLLHSFLCLTLQLLTSLLCLLWEVRLIGNTPLVLSLLQSYVSMDLGSQPNSELFYSFFGLSRAEQKRIIRKGVLTGLARWCTGRISHHYCSVQFSVFTQL